MSKRSLLNIEASFGTTDCDIASLRAQVRDGEQIERDGIDKNANLVKLEACETNASLKQLFDEVREQIEEDFDFIVELCEPDAAFGRAVNPGESELLGSLPGADIVSVICLSTDGETSSKLVMDFGPFIPDTVGNLKINDFISFPAWVPYGYTRNRSESPLILVEMFMRIVGTATQRKEMEEQMNGQAPVEPIIKDTTETMLEQDIPMEDITATEVVDPDELAYAESLHTEEPEATKDAE